MLRVALRAPARVLVLVLITLAGLVVGVAPASASASGDLVSYTNSARADHGLRHLSVAADLSRLAQEHASWMASHRSLEHTSGLGSKVCCWQKVGENVGYGSSARAIFNAFMGSSSHRSNILSAGFTQIGVGAARASDGYLYVDQVFRLPNGASAPSSSYTAPRASRSGTRTPLRVSAQASAPMVRSAGQLRLVKLSHRVGSIQVDRAPDPLRRGVLWVQTMARVTSK
ncbi:MAG: hypothetical protein QOK42_759 [Frankiaceae bacterium]|nr:hypothetical protein [Frankiaceae bacterium]